MTRVKEGQKIKKFMRPLRGIFDNSTHGCPGVKAHLFNFFPPKTGYLNRDNFVQTVTTFVNLVLERADECARMDTNSPILWTVVCRPRWWGSKEGKVDRIQRCFQH